MKKSEVNCVHRNIKEIIEKKVDDLIIKYELESEPEESYSNLVHELYPKDISESYDASYKALIQITIDFAKFPTIAEWNKYAQEHGYLNHISLQFITKLNWNKLRRKVKREITKQKKR